jgi:HK97 family phage major capsid protein
MTTKAIQRAQDLRGIAAYAIADAIGASAQARGLKPPRADDLVRYHNALSDIDAADDVAKRLRTIQDIEAGRSRAIEARADRLGVSLGAAADMAEIEMAAFRNWIIHGLERMPADLRPFAERRIGKVEGAAVGTGAAGGFTVPQEFLEIIEIAQRAYGGMMDVATVLDTDTGADLPMPTNDDTGATGSIIGENTVQPDQDVAFAQVILRTFMYSSGIVKISYQLLQDSAFDVVEMVARAIGTRIARVQNLHFTVGAGGVAQPQGFASSTVGVPIGHTMPNGNTISYTYQGLLSLEHSVDRAYRSRARFMLSDLALRQIRLVVDASGRPIFVPGYTIGNDAVGGQPDTLMGYPMTLNQDMPAPAANARSVAFGDFSKYLIRRVGQVQVVRLQERYAPEMQVAFFGYQRADGRVGSPAACIRLLQNSAT